MSSSLKKSLAIPIVHTWSFVLHTALLFESTGTWYVKARSKLIPNHRKRGAISRTNGTQQRFFSRQSRLPLCSMTGRAQRSSKPRDEEGATVCSKIGVFFWSFYSIGGKRNQQKNWEDMTENQQVKLQRVMSILRQAKQNAPTSEQTEKVDILRFFC